MSYDWDRHLDPPDEPEPPTVDECDTCGADLFAGDEVEYLRETDTTHCNTSCAMTFVDQNPEDFPFGESDRMTTTLDWPDKEDDGDRDYDNMRERELEECE